MTISINNTYAYGINCNVRCIIDECNCSNKLFDNNDCIFYYTLIYAWILCDVELDAMKKDGKCD